VGRGQSTSAALFSTAHPCRPRHERPAWSALPELRGVSVFVFNTGGYRATPFRVGQKGHYEIGGFTDATFRLMAHLENLQDAHWPF
jgi:hypothetical protein